MPITLQSIPADLKADKSVTPYIARAAELESVNVVVSYYCKLYVLEHILSNKLHTTSKDIEKFTIELLDDTESVKNSAEDEGTRTALGDKSISVSIVLSFAYKLFNSCLEGLSEYSRNTNKPALVAKFRATLVFLSLLSIFVNSNEEIDWAKLTGGKASDGPGFDKLNKEKTKTLKYQLSRLLKDEVPFKDDDKELENELNRELEELEQGGDGAVPPEPEEEEPEQNDASDAFKLPGAPQFLPDSTDNNTTAEIKPDEEDEGPFLPSAPKFINSNQDSPILPSTPKTIGSNDDEVKLPGAPHFSPDEEAEEFKLPGAPKYLPDDDLSHINKTSSIQVFPPEKKPEPVVQPPPKKVVRPVPVHRVTKEEVEDIIDKTESIAKVQKHAKFAISALNYEDVQTAEKELREGLRLLELLKKQGE